MTVKLDGFTFLIHQNGKIIVRVSCKKDPTFEHEVSTDCATEKEAADKKVLRYCRNQALKMHEAALAQKQPGVGSTPEAQPAPAGSFLAVLDSMVTQVTANRWAEGTEEEFLRVIKFIKKNLLPIEVQHGPIDAIDYNAYHVLAEALNKDPNIVDSKYQMKQGLRFVTKELIKRDLRRECLEALADIEAKSPHKKRGKPNVNSEILTMIDALKGRPFPIQFLFWVGFSGGPQVSDAASIKRSEIKASTGKVRFDRMKTGGVAEFVLVTEGLQCLNSHKSSDRDVFVLQQLLEPGPLFAVEEIGDLPALVNRLKNPADPVSEFLIQDLSIRDGMALASFDPELNNRKHEKSVRRVVARLLNAALRNKCLWEAARFNKVNLRPQTLDLLKSQGSTSDPADLNRLLLEDAFPDEVIQYPNDVTNSRLGSKASALWRGFLDELEITEKSFKSFRQLITTESLDSAVRDALVARAQGNSLQALRKYDFPEHWQFSCARDLREQLLQAIRTGCSDGFVLTYGQLVDKLKQFIDAYIDAAKDLANRRHRDLAQRIDEASAAASDSVRAALSQHDESEQREHTALMEKAELALRQTEALRRDLAALADVLFGAHANDALLSALTHYLGRELTQDELAAVDRGELPASVPEWNLSDAA